MGTQVRNHKRKYPRCVDCGEEKIGKRQVSPRCRSCNGLMQALLKGLDLVVKYDHCEMCGEEKVLNPHPRCIKCCSKGREHSEEARNKISKSMMGHEVSDEARRKMSIKKTAYWKRRREERKSDD